MVCLKSFDNVRSSPERCNGFQLNLYDTIMEFNFVAKAERGQLNLAHVNKNKKYI